MSSSAAPPARAVCVVRDPALRRTLRRSLCASAADVEFCESLESLEGSVDPDTILFLALDARSGPARAIGARGRTVMLGSLGNTEMLALLGEGGLDHVIADHGPDETELAVTAAKLHSGDIFGLEKYVAWGVAVAELEVASYDDKSAALTRLGEAARSVGARRQMVNRILGSADELLMNALYDAPAIRGGAAPVPDGRGGRRAESPALLRYACDGRHLALSVLDRFGTLDKRTAIDAVVRARADLGRPRAEGGAGLGLYFVLSSVTRFIVNLHPGRRTEVVCLFDLREHPRDSTGWTRSLHVFTAPA